MHKCLHAQVLQTRGKRFLCTLYQKFVVQIASLLIKLKRN
jgi:hypothetical protein